ncbi:MAG: site-specific DNA-methyltransferase [Desulfobacteraceae bacterium]|nr:site-specific DNA-methyltransferase [Desulfobacteraceae bacterium]
MDLILTDPPYGIKLSRGYKKSEPIFGDDGFSVMVFLDDILKEYKRILKSNSAIYIFTRFDVMPYWWLKCKNYFQMKNCIIWAKGGGGKGDLEGNYGNNSEMILFMTNGKHKLQGRREGNVWQIPKTKLEYHETQKPINLLKKIIEKSSKENDIILDPFLGSGTTIVACKQLKRNYIGIEINPEYCKIAEERLAQGVL